MNIANRKILLTGATGGIGRAFAAMLDHEGASLILAGRNAEELKKLNLQFGNRHHTVLADLDTGNGRQAIHDACKTAGIDILINNAGISDFALLEEQSPVGIEQLMMTNLVSPILLTRCLLPLLKASPAGMIINIGSIFGSIGYPGFSSYSASKFGLRGFSEALRRELANTRVKVLYLAPRTTRTAINSTIVNDMNKALGNAIDEPAVVASALKKAMLKNHNNSYLGWPEKLFVHINSLLPGLVDNALRRQWPTIESCLHKNRPARQQ